MFPEPGLCVAHGRAHISTFDHTEYAYYGVCSYTMLYIDDPNINFQVVLIHDENCDINAPCKKKVKIIMPGKVIELFQKVSDTHVVKVDGKIESLPYKTSLPSIRQVWSMLKNTHAYKTFFRLFLFYLLLVSLFFSSRSCSCCCSVLVLQFSFSFSFSLSFSFLFLN